MGPFDHHCTHEADALVYVRVKLLLSVFLGLALEPVLVLLLRNLDSIDAKLMSKGERRDIMNKRFKARAKLEPNSYVNSLQFRHIQARWSA